MVHHDGDCCSRRFHHKALGLLLNVCLNQGVRVSWVLLAGRHAFQIRSNGMKRSDEKTEPEAIGPQYWVILWYQ